MYKIKDGIGITIGVFQSKSDRDYALERFVNFGFPVDDAQ